MSRKSAVSKIMRCICAVIALVFAAIITLTVIEHTSRGSSQTDVYTVVSPAETVVSAAEAVPEPEPEPVPISATLMFGGDVLIHESVYKQAHTQGSSYDFRPYFGLFNDVFTADYNSINLELPVDAHGDNTFLSTYPCFNAPLEILDAVKDMNIQLCTNCNNHMIDQGFDGLVATKQHLNDYGFDSLGTCTSQEEHDSLFIKELNGIKVGICTFTQTTNGIYVSKERERFAFDRMSISPDEACMEILPRVKALREAGAEIVITVLHWGVEYNSYPSADQTIIAKKLCKGGVDVIIGSHPHVVQPIEKLTVSDDDGRERECLVVYSLGNLFCKQSTKTYTTNQGMVVALRLARDESGAAVLDDAFYMPTMLYPTGNSKADYLRLVTPARYISGVTAPEMLDCDGFYSACGSAWSTVTATVGDAIPAVTDPEHYPEGFFEYDYA